MVNKIKGNKSKGHQKDTLYTLLRAVEFKQLREKRNLQQIKDELPSLMMENTGRTELGLNRSHQ
ncbi:hypothetical protein HanXRQr2_Chr10g0436011 [Helianthus annuus]|uniref:Uncharacterized protein n=1 Tax=Helianthus annuus TaxID=4232 RepID=A0A9K3HXI5_HELAN|nr:hypothetical protein HanXRQr2_Chr10g0436011 [Helianthus annuus]